MIKTQIANPAGAVNGQDERATPAVDSLARFRKRVIKGRQQRVLPPLTNADTKKQNLIESIFKFQFDRWHRFSYRNMIE